MYIHNSRVFLFALFELEQHNTKLLFYVVDLKKFINFLAASCVLRLLSVVLRIMVNGESWQYIENKINTRVMMACEL